MMKAACLNPRSLSCFVAGMCSVVFLCHSQAAECKTKWLNHLKNYKNGHLVLSVGYSPACSGVEKFRIGAHDDETLATLPYIQDGRAVEHKIENFDWSNANPKIQFHDSTTLRLMDFGLAAMEGSIGYSIGRGRIELEVGYEKFEAKSRRAKGSKKANEADAVYFLAKELAYNTMSYKAPELARSLAKVSGMDIVTFANVVKALGRRIGSVDRRICNAISDSLTGRGYCRPYSDVEYKAWKRLGVIDILRTLNIELSALFRNEESAQNWPRSTVFGVEHNSSAPVAENIVNVLTKEEREEIARIFVRTIEGGEVVKIEAITSTSVMLNGCFDMFNEKTKFTPYICAGIGSNFVGVADGPITPKLAYKVKAGLSYQLDSSVSAFVGGYYHKVIGSDAYENIPVGRLADDVSPEGRTKDNVVANFSLAYAGGELGFRFSF